jgi:hypothetical protein
VNEKALQFYICWRADFNIYLFVIFNWETIRMIMLPMVRCNPDCNSVFWVEELPAFLAILRKREFLFIVS